MTTSLTRKDGESLKNALMRLHAGRCAYLYTGQTDQKDVLVVGTTDESNMKFGDPEQLVAIVQVKDPILLEMIITLLSAFGVDHTSDVPMTVSLKQIVSVANKVKWDLTKIIPETDPLGLPQASYEWEGKRVQVEVTRPASSAFFQNLIQEYSKDQLDILLGNEDRCHYVSNIDPVTTPRVYRYCIADDAFEGGPLSSFKKKRRHLTVVQGIEVPVVSQVAKTATKVGRNPESGIVIWTSDGTSLRFGGYYRDEAMSYIVSRVFAFII